MSEEKMPPEMERLRKANMDNQELGVELERLQESLALPRRYALIVRSRSSSGFLLIARDEDGDFTKFFNSKQRLLEYLEQLDL